MIGGERILGIGVTHYPRFASLDEDMAEPLRFTLEDPDLPVALRTADGWPEAMAAEWRDPGAAARHRALLREGFRRTRQAIDEFQPDVVLVWGDDQYENFRDDIIPAFTVLAYDDLELRPWATRKQPNIWGEGADLVVKVRGARDAGKALATGLLDAGFDVAYAYQPLHHEGLAHAFANTILFLDQDRVGFEHRVLCMPINCYGRRVVSHQGRNTRLAEASKPPDPPSPSPRRCMDLGRATVEVLLETGLRVALVASSSWSHAFLVDHSSHLYPDIPADRVLYDALERGDHGVWRSRTLAEIEQAGQHEMLNWFCLLGAMEALDRRPSWSTFVETHVFNSNKCFAIY